MSQPPNPPMDDSTPSSARPYTHPSPQPSTQPSVQPDAAGWTAPPPPSWAPPWEPPAAPVGPGGPLAGARPTSPAQPNGKLLPALAALVGLLVGIVGAGLVVTALFAGSAEDIGREIADQVGQAIEKGIVDGSRQAMEDTMSAFPEDMGFPGGPVPAAEQFPPVPPEDLGPDPVLDDYAQQCFDGALQACDDLLYESPPMSQYETYGATCGGRVKEYTVGTCTELE